jgi:hypothetical protein
VVLFGGCIPRHARAQEPDPCTPSAAVKAALDALPTHTPNETEWEFHEKTLAAIQALLRQHPDDVFVQRRYINEMYDRTDRPRVIEEYKARFGANPDNPHLAYIYGVALLGRKSSESIKLFDSALDKDRQFPWPHLQLVWIYSSPVFHDKSKSDAHLKAFLGACPATFEGYEALKQTDDKDVIRQRASQLRTLLEKRNDVDAIAAYQTLWALEFKATPPSEYEVLRKRTAQDVQRIRALNLKDEQGWYKALEDGYKLANDQKNADWAKEEGELHYPDPWMPASYSKWFQVHHFPGEDATPETKRAYYADLLEQANKWVKERPNTTFMWSMRLDALIELDGIASAEIENAADQVFRVAQKNSGPSGPASDEYFSVARALSGKHLQPARVLEMAQKGLERLEIEQKEPDYDLYADKEQTARSHFYTAYRGVEGQGYASDAYIELKQRDKAQITLSRIDERLQDLKSLAGDKNDHKRSYLQQLSVYWGRMGRVAELQESKLDAMAFYENALLTRLEAEQKPALGVKDELAENAKKLWSSLGGTDEGWTMWYERRANELSRLTTLRWDDANEPLATFEIADLNGKTWNLESLKGKVTFLNFWASW